MSEVFPPLSRDQISRGLANAAAQKRFSNRRRRFDASFSDRRRSRALRLVAVGGFLLLLGLPGAASIFYHGWWAADQFESEARFVLEADRSALASGGLGDMIGAPSVEMTRDTLIIVDYLRSRTLVETLEAEIGLRARFEGPDIDLGRPFDRLSPDPLARLEADSTIETLVEYWRDQVDVGVSAGSGIVTLKVRAFTPQDAADIARSAVAHAETLVNDMNVATWRDAVDRAEELYAEAAALYAAAETQLAAARAEEGVIDAGATAALMGGVAAEARATLLALERDYAARAQHLAPTAPSMTALARRIETVRRQIAEIETAMAASETDDRTLADAMGRFSQIDTERDIAERRLLAAAATLETVREISQRQLLFLDVFVAPQLAEEATYPRRGWAIAVTLSVGLLAWGAVVGLFSLVRHHIA